MVVSKHVKEGNYLKTGDTLFKIVDLDKLWAFLDAYESDLPWLRFGQEVSFSVEKGELFGLIGPDGAGKTTLIRILTTLLLADSGAAQVEEWEVVKDYRAIRRNVGYMPGRFSLYPDLTVEANLRFFATAFGTTIEAQYDVIAPIYGQIEPFREDVEGDTSFLMFHPVYAAGFGGLAWMSLDVDAPDGRTVLHGPLYGALGWLHVDTPHAFDELEDGGSVAVGGARSSLSLLLGGVLWMDYEELDDDGEVVDARTGPLWSMFGTGRDDGDDYVSLFWIPVPI